MPKKNQVKPTEKQKQTFKHMKKAKSLQEAMLAGGYSKKTSINPKQNFIDSKGAKVLFKQYKNHLTNAGISPELLAEVQAEGLFDQNAQVRLGYLKETKKDFGLIHDSEGTKVQVNVFDRATKNADEFVEGEEV